MQWPNNPDAAAVQLTFGMHMHLSLLLTPNGRHQHYHPVLRHSTACHAMTMGVYRVATSGERARGT